MSDHRPISATFNLRVKQLSSPDTLQLVKNEAQDAYDDYLKHVKWVQMITWLSERVAGKCDNVMPRR